MNKISPVSFGSTYKIQLKENTVNAYFKALELEPKDIDPKAQDIYEHDRDNTTRTIVVDDRCDSYVEGFLKLCQAKFRKKTNEQLFSKSNIVSKLMPINPNNHTNLPAPVEIDAEKLDKKLEEMKFPQCTKEHKEYYSKLLSDKIKADMPIIAPELNITCIKGKPDIKFVAGYTTYEFLKELGMKKIPFIINENSYNIANSMGLTN